MAAVSRWLREPLVHFIVAGTVLFGAFHWYRGPTPTAADTATITVDRRNLLSFLQYRANAFEPETFGAALDAMSNDELETLIDAYVDEEVLYREARELGLEQSDNIIRQRMVQKMRFLLADVAAAGAEPAPAALAAYFEANIDAYAIQPWATFTHVFFDATHHGETEARALAEATRRELNAAGAGFNDATDRGDTFPYLDNYVERTFEFIASHFGDEFAAALAQIDASASEWQGPLLSAFGEHVVLLTRREERALPSLDEVRGDVERDYANERSTAALAEMTEAMRERYRIDVGEIRSRSAP
jgi:hypothetical protein